MRPPTYLLRDNDRAYGQAFRRRIRAMGIRDRPISPRSSWQNAYAERLIGTLRRECLDHVLIVGERHLRRLLASYSSYYNASRTHCSLNKNAPVLRWVHRIGPLRRVPWWAGCITNKSESELSADTMGDEAARAQQVIRSVCERYSDPSRVTHTLPPPGYPAGAGGGRPRLRHARCGRGR